MKKEACEEKAKEQGRIWGKNIYLIKKNENKQEEKVKIIANRKEWREKEWREEGVTGGKERQRCD